MIKLIKAVLLMGTICAQNAVNGPVDVTYLKKILNDMEDHFLPGKKFDQEYFEKLVSCLNEDDPILLQSQNHGWQEIIQYYLSNGTQQDSNGRRDLWGE